MDILIADDHPLYRDALSMLAQQLSDDVNTTTASCYDDVIQLVRGANSPDLILVDLHMPGIDAWQGISTLRELCPDIPLVVISSSESENDHSKALQYGAQGFIPKSLEGESLINALRLIVESGITLAPVSNVPQKQTLATSKLTKRQHEVLQLLANGESNKLIARNLGLSEGTVKLHVRAVFTALNVSNRTQAVVTGEKLGLVKPESCGFMTRRGHYERCISSTTRLSSRLPSSNDI